MVNISNVLMPRAPVNSSAGNEAPVNVADRESGMSSGTTQAIDVAAGISACFPPVGTGIVEAILNAQPLPSRALASAVAGMVSDASAVGASPFAVLGEAPIARSSSSHASFARATHINDPLAAISACFPPIGTLPTESMLNPQPLPPRDAAAPLTLSIG